LGLDDTIVAIATAPGEAAVAMVRLSGPQAASIAQRLFRPTRAINGRMRSHRLYHGYIVDPTTEHVVDEVMLAYMRRPRTYTRQDVVEITGHGGPVGVREILRLAVAEGARPAERGEMTLRAFLSGRIDLAQAEAVLDTVRARTPAALAIAVDQMAGGLSRSVAAIRDEVMALFAQLEAAIDFAEDDVPPLAREEIVHRVQEAATAVAALLSTSETGRIYREGLRVALVGRPNAGKSSLLNALLQSERAIVTSVPGTTRDVIEESIDLEGMPVVLLDTAGITHSTDPVEQIGVERSRRALIDADVVVLVVDSSGRIGDQDREVAGAIRDAREPGDTVVVLSKCDLPPMTAADEAAQLVAGGSIVSVSSVDGTGLAALRATLRRAALGGRRAAIPGSDTAGLEHVVASTRHRDALRRAAAALEDASRAAQTGLPEDFVCVDLRAALDALGEITGQHVTEGLLESIFSRFCIGK
jgi:tRNA modification GTPase